MSPRRRFRELRRQCRPNDLPSEPVDKRVALLQFGSIPLRVRKRPLSQTPKDPVERTCSPFSENEPEDPPLDRKRPRRVFSVQIPPVLPPPNPLALPPLNSLPGPTALQGFRGLQIRPLPGGRVEALQSRACLWPAPSNKKRRGASPQDEKTFSGRGASPPCRGRPTNHGPSSRSTCLRGEDEDAGPTGEPPYPSLRSKPLLKL